MADQYNARAFNRATSKVLVENLTLAKTITGHYEHDQAQTFENGIKCQLATIMNLANPRNGMKNLLEESENPTKRFFIPFPGSARFMMVASWRLMPFANVCA